ncbi:hypothetical protein [Flavobacterium kingsejongi]|uniref:hypothetical protein n=1 Tax=Flavobacterium kingsejongi TaxID=1678728 RepID=UPI0026D1D17E|nr:hypothetical protein [Flavobacterium kingsejongi]
MGDNDGFSAEVTYQRALSSDNRLEVDLGWRSSDYRGYDYNAVKLTGLYQWVWNIDKGFNWYAGVGGGIGTWSYDFDHNGPYDRDYDDSGALLYAAGNIGIEYNFDIPLMVALDFRPEFYFTNDDFRNDHFGPDIALSVRYRF